MRVVFRAHLLITLLSRRTQYYEQAVNKIPQICPRSTGDIILIFFFKFIYFLSKFELGIFDKGHHEYSSPLTYDL